MTDWRRSDWHPGSDVHWESWSINGEVCIAGLVPPFAGCARLACCLVWLLRSFASSCRRTYDSTGALVFTYCGARTPTTLARALSLRFDVALQDARLIRQHVHWRGGDANACRWPSLWLEGSTIEYLPETPFPRGREARQKLVVLAEERQVFVSARPAKLADSVRLKWAKGLEMLASVDDDAVASLLHEDEQGFLVNMFVLVHKQPARKVQPRPSLQESYRRHEMLMAELVSLGEAKRLPVAWHALWRLPPGMTWDDPVAQPWTRYPAVSFAMGVRPLQRDPSGATPSVGASRRGMGLT